MNKDDIKKGIECCTKPNCKNCPYLQTTKCNDTLCEDALNLITKQEQEIGRLKDEIKQSKIDILNKVKERGLRLIPIELYHLCNIVDKLIKEIEK